MPAVSVIVPAYNVEKYIGECLDNVCKQTFADIEIICVDDGSGDSTPDILKEYALRDDRIRVLTQENKGASGARNAGLRVAQGKYVYFMDSDDYLELDALEKLYGLSEKESLDIIIFKLINVKDETGEKYSTDYYDMAYLKEAVGDRVFSHRDIPEDVYRIAVSPPGKFFNRQILSGIEFVEGVIFEDNVFFIDALFKAERVAFVDEYLCNRRIRTDSVMNPKENYMDYIQVSNMIIDVTKRHGLYDEYKLPLLNKTLTNTYLRFTEVSDDIKPEFFRRMKEDFLAKKDEYDSCSEFQNEGGRIREIFYKVLECDTYREYALSIELFDTQTKLEELTEAKRQVNREKQRLLNRTHDLSKKVNSLANENRRLKNK